MNIARRRSVTAGSGPGDSHTADCLLDVAQESSATEVENKCRNPDERFTVYFKNSMIEIDIELINEEGLISVKLQ